MQRPGGIVDEVALDGGPTTRGTGALLGPQIPDVELAASFLAFYELSVGCLAIARPGHAAFVLGSELLPQAFGPAAPGEPDGQCCDNDQ